MPQSDHNRLAELHNLAEHSHEAAARDKADHLTPHELTQQAEEQAREAKERDAAVTAKAGERNKA
jgi:hypothetical protein